jgi:uncharacterized coiled-coil protein SlyX
MRERLEQRLQELRSEYKKGEQTLAELEQQATATRQALLRISGAIQVLEEELGESAEHQNNSGAPSAQKTGPANEAGSAPVVATGQGGGSSDDR